MNATRKVPLGRLPFAVREELCARLRDRQTAEQINAWLVAEGHAPEPYNAQNFTNFRNGSYKEWLKEQAHLDEVRKRAESVRRELAAGGFDMLDKTIWDLANTLSDADIDPTKAAAAVANLKNSVNGAERVRVSERRADLAEEALRLENKKFQRTTCELFIKWAADRRALEIATQPGVDGSARIEKLGHLIFQDDW